MQIPITQRAWSLPNPTVNSQTRAKEGLGQEAQTLHPFIRTIFYCLVFSLPFEATNFPVENFTLTKSVGYIFFLSTLVQPRVCFRKPPLAFWLFAIYVVVIGVLGTSQPLIYQDEIQERFISTIQLLIFFWLSCNLLQEEKVATGAIAALATGCLFLSFVQIAGIGNVSKEVSGDVRVSALGDNPNAVARLQAVGLLAVAGLAYGRYKTAIIRSAYAIPWIGFIGMSILKTGSRGGMVALAASMFAFMLGGRTLAIRLRNVVVVLLGMAVIVVASLQVDIVRKRWEEALTKGKLANRENLYPAAWKMVQEKPYTGWGPIAYRYEVGARTYHFYNHKNADTHNIYLQVLVQSGIVGGVPFFLGLLACLVAGWKSRKGLHGILPFAMMVAVLVINTSGEWMYVKIQWFLFGYILSRSRAVPVEEKELEESENLTLTLSDQPLLLSGTVDSPNLQY